MLSALKARFRPEFLNRVDDIAEYVDWDLHKMLLAGEPQTLKQTEKLLKDKFGGELDIYLSAPWFLEVMPKGIDKGVGLKLFVRIWEYPQPKR